MDRISNLGRRVGCLVCSFFFALTACGQTNIAAGPIVAPVLPDAGGSLLRVTGALALVIGIFLGGVWLFKNWRRLALQQGRGPKLQVLETRALGGRHAIYVLGYEQQRFLISASPSGVSLLSHLPAATENDSAEGTANVSRPAFAQALAQVLKGK
ncbi:MAG TPA: flagellar biosynthetic protein FliO [Verrucomicrobiae bacterium]